MTSPALGQALALASAVFFAFSVVCVSRSEVRSGDRGVFFSVLVTVVFSSLLWLVQEGGATGIMGTPAWWRGVGWFALAGICAMVLGRTFVFASIRALGVTRAAATKRLNPFFSVAVAALVLQERVSGLAWLGMGIIAIGFGLLVRDTLKKVEGKDSVPLSSYGWGVASAMAYACAYTARKLGLAELPVPAFGTLISALAGLAFILAGAAVSARNRATVTGVFRNLDRWTIAAGVCMSIGQIANFVALLHERISVIVMISSMEIFIASFLAVVVFRTESRPNRATQIAAVIATAGVILVAMG